MRCYEYGCCCTNRDKMVLVLEGTKAYPSVCPVRTSTRSCDRENCDKLIEQGYKKIIFFLSQPEVLVAIETKEKSYMHAILTL